VKRSPSNASPSPLRSGALNRGHVADTRQCTELVPQVCGNTGSRPIRRGPHVDMPLFVQHPHVAGAERRIIAEAGGPAQRGSLSQRDAAVEGIELDCRTITSNPPDPLFCSSHPCLWHA
jgi:hypothetical protein